MQQIPPIFLNLNMKLYYLDNCNLMLIPIGLATLAYIYFSIKKSWILKRYLKTKEVFVKDEFFDLRRKVDLLYGNFIFSYTISLLYITVFSVLVYELSQTGNQDLNNYAKTSYAVSMVVLFFIAIIFCSEAFNGVQKQQAVVIKDNVFNEQKALERDNNCQNQDYHPLYVSVYLLYQLLIIVLINSIFADFDRLTEVLSISAAIYMIVMMVWRPYIFKIHNFAIVFNQAIVVIFLGFQLLQKYGILNEATMEVNLYLTISLIGIALALQVARLYIQLSSPIHVFKKTEQKSEVKRKKVDLKDQKNRFLMVNQIKQKLKEDLKIDEVEEIVNTETFNREFCHRVMNKKKLKIDIPTNSQGNTMLADKIINMNKDEFNENGPKERDNDVDIEVVKDRLRRQLNYKKNRAVLY